MDQQQVPDPQPSLRPVEPPLNDAAPSGGCDALLRRIEELRAGPLGPAELGELTENLVRLSRIWRLGGYDIEGQRDASAISSTIMLGKTCSAMAVSPDGRWLAVAEGSAMVDCKPARLSFFDLTNRYGEAPIRIASFELDEFIADMEFGPKTNALAFASSDRAGLLQLIESNGAIELEYSLLAPNTHHSVSFSPDGSVLACAATHARATLNALEEDPAGSRLSVTRSRTVASDVGKHLCFSSCGSFAFGLASGKLFSLAIPAGADLQSGYNALDPLRRLQPGLPFPRPGQILALAVDRKSPMVALGERAADGSFVIALCAVSTDGSPKEIALLPLPAEPSAVRFSPDGQVLAVGLKDKGMAFFEVCSSAHCTSLLPLGELVLGRTPLDFVFLDKHGQIAVASGGPGEHSPKIDLVGPFHELPSEALPDPLSFGALPAELLVRYDPPPEPEDRSTWQKFKDWLFERFVFRHGI